MTCDARDPAHTSPERDAVGVARQIFVTRPTTTTAPSQQVHEQSGGPIYETDAALSAPHTELSQFLTALTEGNAAGQFATHSTWYDPMCNLFDPELNMQFNDQIDDAFRSWLSSPLLPAVDSEHPGESSLRDLPLDLTAALPGGSTATAEVSTDFSSARYKLSDALSTRAPSAAAIDLPYATSGSIWPSLESGHESQASARAEQSLAVSREW